MESTLRKHVLAGSVFLILTYGSTILFPALWSDDYVAIKDTVSLSYNLLGDLRPTWAILNLLVFSAVSFPTSLVIAKLASVIFMIMTFRTMIQVISPSHHAKKLFTILFLVSLTLPSFSITVHWLVFWQNSAAFFLACLSVNIFFFSKKTNSVIVSFLLFLLSFSIYPPSAFGCFGLLALIIRFNLSKTLIPRIQLLIFLGVSITSTLTSIAISSALLRFFNTVPASRVSLLDFSGLPDKLLYLIKVAILPFNIFSVTRPTEGIHLIITMFCILVFFLNTTLPVLRNRKSLYARNILLADVIALISLLPLALTRDNQIELRLIPGFALYITVCVLFFITSILKIFFDKLGQSISSIHRFPIASVVLVSFLTIGMVTSQVRYFNFFHYQFIYANKFISNNLSDCIAKGNTEMLHIVQINEVDYSKMIGIYSMKTDFASSWVPHRAIALNIEKVTGNSDFGLDFGNERSRMKCEIDLNSLQENMSFQFLW